ncbi:PDR/VanB family oxidoreductase [Ramlibacter sp. AN1015]|uniref:PDR/VanB family oxidoreductase n=1 Tax=Ramlibacter sp. AN1015 TaxID=3133428 RepID=UPI0030C38218
MNAATAEALKEPNAPPTASLPALVPVRVHARRALARSTWLYELRCIDSTGLPPASPGAHLDVELPDGTLRQYSLLAGLSEDPRALVIAVKRDAAGRGGSQRLCDTVRPGDLLRVSAPRNNFALHEGPAPAVLIAGGIGITPMWSMLQALRSRATPWELHYGCRSRDDAALIEALEPLTAVRLHFDDAQGGRPLDLAAIVAAAPPDAHLYCCGPAPMLDAFEAAAAHWPAHRRHLERFSAAQPMARAESGYMLRLARSGQLLPVAPGQTILEVIRAAGLEAPSSCEQGICGACETRVLEGDVDHRDSILSPDEQAANCTMMICCSGCKGSRLVLDL